MLGNSKATVAATHKIIPQLGLFSRDVVHCLGTGKAGRGCSRAILRGGLCASRGALNVAGMSAFDQRGRSAAAYISNHCTSGNDPFETFMVLSCYLHISNPICK